MYWWTNFYIVFLRDKKEMEQRFDGVGYRREGEFLGDGCWGGWHGVEGGGRAKRRKQDDMRHEFQARMPEGAHSVKVLLGMFGTRGC